MADSKKTTKDLGEEIRALRRDLYGSNPDAITVCDMQGRLLDANKAFLDMLGYTLEELKEKTYEQITPRKWHKMEADVVKDQILKKGFSKVYEKEYIRKDGSTFPVAVRVNTTKEEHGKPLLAWCFMRDITERKKMEEELRQSEEKYRSLIANTPGVVWTSGQNGNTIFISSNVEGVYGYSPEEIYKGGDRLWFGRIHPDDVDRVKDSFRNVFEEATPLDIEYRIQRKDGEWIWIQDRSFGAYEKDGVRYADGVFFDITRRKRAEEKLQEHAIELEARVEERTKDLVERVKELDCLYSISSLLQDPNLSLREVFQGTVDLVRPSWRYPEITCARLVLEGEEFRTKNYRETAWKQTSNIVVRDVNVGLVEVCYLEEKPQRDEGPFLREERNLVDAIAEHLARIVVYKRMEELERQHQAELAHCLRLSTIGEMTAGLSHEVNQPLCSIATHAKGALRMMKSGSWESGELVDAMEEIGAQAERAGQIIHRIRRLIHKRNSRRSSVDIENIVDEAVRFVQSEVRLGRITIQRVKPPEKTPMLQVDSIQIEQVLLNLLRNSFEAMDGIDDSKREVTIEVSTDENNVVQVTVSDTGKGMSVDNIDRVFEPFFTTKSGGLGMGLAISRSIIEAHGGRIWAESSPGGGAIFRFTLPAEKRTS